MKLKLFLVSIISLSIGATAKAALVPCGPGFLPPDDKCQFCHLFTLLDKIFDFIFVDLIPPVAVLAVIVAGVYFFAVAGNPQNQLKAKSVLTSVVIGLLIIYGSWLIINLFLSTIGLSEGEFGSNIKNWFEYPCY
jgi:type IV secretory pathway VirB2 component (pilin)